MLEKYQQGCTAESHLFFCRADKEKISTYSLHLSLYLITYWVQKAHLSSKDQPFSFSRVSCRSFGCLCRFILKYLFGKVFYSFVKQNWFLCFKWLSVGCIHNHCVWDLILKRQWRMFLLLLLSDSLVWYKGWAFSDQCNLSFIWSSFFTWPFQLILISNRTKKWVDYKWLSNVNL